MTAADSPSVDLEQCKAAIFDVDGTLYDQRPMRRRMATELLIHVALRPWRVGLLRRLQLFRHERERLSDEEASSVSSLQYERPARALGVSPEGLRTEVEEWIERRPLRHLPACRVPGVRRLFAGLRARNVRIGVLSDYPAAAKLEALGLHADVVVSGADSGVDRFKPHPAGLLAVLDRLGEAPEDCVLIGDRDDRDGECARRAGVACLLRGAGPEARFLEFTELL